jgi:Uma2 family endonuclease
VLSQNAVQTNALPARRRFTVDDYFRMVEVGILGEDDRVELVDGEVVSMNPISLRHMASVDRATRAFGQQVGVAAIVRVHGSVRLSLFNQPEPDLVLLKPREDFYAAAHAGPSDIMLIVEVADSSAAYDRLVKAELYARCDVLEYWLADLPADFITRFRAPVQGVYSIQEDFGRGVPLSPLLLPSCVVPSDELLGH